MFEHFRRDLYSSWVQIRLVPNYTSTWHLSVLCQLRHNHLLLLVLHSHHCFLVFKGTWKSATGKICCKAVENTYPHHTSQEVLKNPNILTSLSGLLDGSVNHIWKSFTRIGSDVPSHYLPELRPVLHHWECCHCTDSCFACYTDSISET